MEVNVKKNSEKVDAIRKEAEASPTEIHVVKSGSRWEVRMIAGDTVTRTFETKEEAV